MRAYTKAEYVNFEKKGKDCLEAAKMLSAERLYDQAVTIACLGLINLMDALSINLFERDNRTADHKQAPFLLQKKLSGVGKSDFKGMLKKISNVLQLKNLASYEGRGLTRKDAGNAIKALEDMIKYYNGNVNRLV